MPCVSVLGCNPSNNGIVVMPIKCHLAQEKTYSFQLSLSHLFQILPSLPQPFAQSVSTRSVCPSLLLKDGAHRRTEIPVMLA